MGFQGPFLAPLEGAKVIMVPKWIKGYSEEDFKLVPAPVIKPHDHETTVKAKWRTWCATVDNTRKCAETPENPFGYEKRIQFDQFAGHRDETPKPKRTNHNQRARRYWEAQGYEWTLVETFNPILMRSKDLMGCIDGLAMGKGETIGVQVCSKSSISARKKKALGTKGLATWLSGGNRFVILAFEPTDDGKWSPCPLVELTQEDLRGAA